LKNITQKQVILCKPRPQESPQTPDRQTVSG
jgi:hypothetical protein